jgi:hypothetical protein
MTLGRQHSGHALQGLLDQLLFCHGRIVLVLIEDSHVPAWTAARFRWHRGPACQAARSPGFCRSRFDIQNANLPFPQIEEVVGV